MLDTLLVPKIFNNYADTFRMLGLARSIVDASRLIGQPNSLQLIDEDTRYRIRASRAIDGTTLDVPDSEANAICFGYPGSRKGTRAAFPKVRVVLLLEAGTHLITDALMCPYRIENPSPRTEDPDPFPQTP